MSCDRVRRRIVLVDSLTPDEKSELIAHLQVCHFCSCEWMQWEKLKSMFSNLPKVTSSSHDRKKLMAYLIETPSVAKVSCEAMRQHIWLWLDGQLPTEYQSAFIVHLANCDRCQVKVWQTEQYLQLMRTVPLVEAPEGAKFALKAKISHSKPSLVKTVFPWRIVTTFAAAAAVLVIALIGRQFFWKAPIPTHTTVVKEVPKAEYPTTEQPKVSTSHAVSKMHYTKPSQPLRLSTQVKVAKLPSFNKFGLPKANSKATTLIPSSKPTVSSVSQHQPVEEEVIKPAESPTSSETSLSLSMPEASSEVLKSTTLPDITSTVISSTVQSPVPSQPVGKVRQLVALPPITIDREESLAPPRLRFSALPPSQQLYRQFGVAFKGTPSENQTVKVSESLSSELSISLISERVRSRTATLPLVQLGFSW